MKGDEFHDNKSPYDLCSSTTPKVCILIYY